MQNKLLVASSSNPHRCQTLPIKMEVSQQGYFNLRALEGLYLKLSALEGLYLKLSALEGKLSTLEGSYLNSRALEGLYLKLRALEVWMKS